MKKKLLMLVLLIFGSLLLTGCGSKKTTQEETTPGGSEQTNKEESGKGSIWDLFSKGKSLKCTFQKAGESVSQTVYLSGKNLRMDFSGKQGEKIVESYMILKNDFAYLWSADNKNGMKWPVNSQEQEGGGKAEWRKELDNSLDYRCSVWVPDNSKFNPPGDVTFQDLTDTMNKAKEQMCASCKQMPAGDSREQCLKGAGCE